MALRSICWDERQQQLLLQWIKEGKPVITTSSIMWAAESNRREVIKSKKCYLESFSGVGLLLWVDFSPTSERGICGFGQPRMGPPTSLRPVLRLHHPPGEEFLPHVQSEPLKVQLEALPLVVSICQCQKRGPIISVTPHQVAVGCSWISPAFFPQTKQVQLPCSLRN